MNKLTQNFWLFAGIAMSCVPLAFAEEPGPKQPGFKPYPLDVCLVGGEKLGNMGVPFTFKFEGREVKFCCKGCLDDFKKDHKKFVGKLEAADKNPKPSGSKPEEHKHPEHKH